MSFLYIQDLRGNPVRALWLHWYVVCIPGLSFICHSGFSHGGTGRAGESNSLGDQDNETFDVSRTIFFQALASASSSFQNNLAILSLQLQP